MNCYQLSYLAGHTWIKNRLKKSGGGIGIIIKARGKMINKWWY
jgi:hypothetical protein